jgi:glutaredoxin-related protein
MIFVFPPHIQAGIISGTHEVVKNSAGVLLGIARDTETGRFVGSAIGMVAEPLFAIPDSAGVLLGIARDLATDRFVGSAIGMVAEPLFAIPDFVLGVAQMVQTDLGFKETYKRLDVIQYGLNSLSANVGILSASTAVIGVGVVAIAAMSAVNLHQTLKMREDIKELKLTVTHGFISIGALLKDHKADVIAEIKLLAESINFEHHRLILSQAYGKFAMAQKLIQSALLMKDKHTRNSTLTSAQHILATALADYNNPELFKATCAVGYLRRVECAWAIEQTISLTYQLLNEPASVSNSLSHLQERIRQDILTVIERCTKDEIDFIFPEITRIYNQDLAVLNSWQNQVDWMLSLSADERQQLASLNMEKTPVSTTKEEVGIVAEPAEIALYQNLQQKSHFKSLVDQLRFLIKPSLREKHESYISQKANTSGYKALAPSSWQEVNDLTVANLYWYFQGME